MPRLRGFDRPRGMRRLEPDQLDSQPDGATAPPQVGPQQADRQPDRIAAEIMRRRMLRRSMLGDGQGGYNRDRMPVQGRVRAGGFSPDAIGRLRDRLDAQPGRPIKALYR